ncbi:NADP-dependent oxidoreductase domain-containing protein [Ostreococcus tauri]|uniref:NADP-dependent oxidoreductase domain-containing protein n=2 Tax=Ostreococcus tauri TaxID=70448 RepID=A0A1Y5IF12_OSTTA|nr:NADP-dependent oxidoreductase domain-containing protein [Ostreococcus tauri]
MLPRTSLRRIPLGHAKNVAVTEVCLGTMTWGVQNTESEAHEQLDYAVKTRGVNFIDTAEMYPVPSSAPGWKPGRTEEIIGNWLEKNGPELRRELVLATKVSGYQAKSETAANRTIPAGEPCPARLDRESVLAACEASLRRLKTDYIDLYQVHWPDRYLPIGAFSGSTEYDQSKERPNTVPIRETVAALGELIKAGKIKHYGLSNESTFGVCEFVRAADELGVPRPVSIQNSYCLLHRQFDTEVAEACAKSNYNILLLPWTPLAGGALTGKYLDGARPEGARLTMFRGFQQRYINPNSVEATKQYKKIADEAGISLTTMALNWCKTRPFATSTIIGATTMEQLKENIDAFEPSVKLSKETLKAIDKVHLNCRDPCIG